MRQSVCNAHASNGVGRFAFRCQGNGATRQTVSKLTAFWRGEFEPRFQGEYFWVFRKLDTFCYLTAANCTVLHACSRFDRILALCDRQTDGIAVASTAFAMRVLRRAVKMDSLLSKVNIVFLQKKCVIIYLSLLPVFTPTSLVLMRK